MIRTPLRPLARILDARRRGENPDAIERENLRLRREEMRDRDRRRAEGRLLVLAGLFLAGFTVIGGQMAVLARSEPSEPRTGATGARILTQRADITDRQGRVLATNFDTHSLYAQPHRMIDPAGAAAKLAEIFPDLDAGRLTRDFTGKRKFLWIRRTLSPEQKQAVHDIGEPGLLFGPREMRLYPGGRLAAHVLGGAGFGDEGVSAAEVIGVAGLEKALDARLRDPARAHEPLRLSLDLSVQAAMEKVLSGGLHIMNAKGAAGILMDAASGEIVALASLPDFDPNTRPAPPTQGSPDDSPLFNRAVQGVYELGSTFKTFTIAQALERGQVTPETMINTESPLTWGKYRIRDFHDYGREMSVTKVLVKSSNVGTARIATEIGAERQQAFLRTLGLLDPVPLEITEAGGSQPLLPPNWSEISTMTISYGHGLAISPLHLAAAYATVVNGGRRVTPTLLRNADRAPGPRVLSETTSATMRDLLRRVVTEGTASLAEVPGYAVGGKTGTADKPKPGGGYYEDRVIATFAGMFPAHDPRYVIVVTLDEPVETSGEKPRRTAGWTAVPVAAEIIRRTAPLLGLRPAIEQAGAAAIRRTSN
ncbi:peptidoglycan D,D-transpeptidase FtsI family protein [Roseovarius ramblicola]|uniref:Peptidoglycan D,D-transpeptidase FtsI family protein n=1 Tax=Roseovarius ramblicola TaxID=2022336 RepID=A0ABV5I032_9RHOB